MLRISMLVPLIACKAAFADAPLFSDDFQDKLADGWTWVRENPEGWRVTEKGLEIRVEPGNMWGPPNDARNVLVRPIPEFSEGAVSIAVTVENNPTWQYEQIDLVWYYDDSNMVKIGLELVNGELSMVMGREEADKTRTIAIVPVTATKLDLRFTARGTTLLGEFREAPEKEWRSAGECTLPGSGPAKASIQAYQGPPDAEHWARITSFSISKHE